ncbi:MAG: hypothetical protein ACXVCY_12865 [Pseudobdellovibrionaceae bacterium]
MNPVEIERFRIKASFPSKTERRTELPKSQKGEKFFAGPIPWSWWSKASRLPGKTLQVAAAIWHIGTLKKSRTLQLQGGILKDLGVTRKAVYRALDALEKANLISCERGPGRRPIITVLDTSDEITGNGNESGMKGDP